MPDDGSLRQAWVFERFWDALVSGRTATSSSELEPDVVAVARRLRALDRHAMTDPTFESNLWEDLMQNHSLGASIPFRRTLLPSPNGRGSTQYPATQPRTTAARRRVATGLTWLATGALIAAVLAMGFFIYRNDQRAVIVVDETPALVATPAMAATPEGWLQFKGDAARTGNVPGPGPIGDPAELWKVNPFGVGGDILTDAPAVADGVLYVDYGEGLVALDVTDGSELWVSRDFGGTPAIDGDGIIVRSETGAGVGLDLARLRRSDGSVVWTAAVGQVTDSWAPAMVDGIVYIPTMPNDILAVDAVTGAEVWRATLTAPASRSVAVADGAVYVGLVDGTLVALEATGGDLLWTASAPGTTLGVPTVANGTVYLSTRDGATNAYDAFDQVTGEPRWSFVAPGGDGFYYGSVDATTVYVPSMDGSLYALDSTTGTLRWSFAAGGSALSSTPIVVGDTIYLAGGNGMAYAIDALTGLERWRFGLEGRSSGSPAIVDGVLYVTTEYGWISAIGGSEAEGVTDSPPTVATPASAEVPTTASSPVTSNTTSADFVWASRGSASDPLGPPSEVRLAPDGTLWVTATPCNIFIFDLDGNLLENWAPCGSGPGEFAFTEGTDVLGTITFASDGSFYVVDTFNFRIQHFARDRTYLDEFGSRGSEDGQFLLAGYLGIAPDGTLWITDIARNDVQHFDANGAFLGKITGADTTEGELFGPAGVTISSDGTIYVVELLGDRVRIFAPVGSTRGVLGANGPDFGGLDFPADIVLDADGYLYVADQNKNRVVVFDPAGRYVFEWGTFGSGDGEFSGAGSIAVNQGGSVYVVDWRNNRIEKFTITGPFPRPAASPVAEATPAA